MSDDKPKKTHCEMTRTLRSEGAGARDKSQCYSRAEFFVVLRGGTADQGRFTCAQHLSKAVRAVRTLAPNRAAARMTVALLEDLDEEV